MIKVHTIDDRNFTVGDDLFYQDQNNRWLIKTEVVSSSHLKVAKNHIKSLGYLKQSIETIILERNSNYQLKLNLKHGKVESVSHSFANYMIGYNIDRDDVRMSCKVIATDHNGLKVKIRGKVEQIIYESI